MSAKQRKSRHRRLQAACPRRVKSGNTLIEQKASAYSPKADKKLTAQSAPEPNDRTNIGFPLLPGGIRCGTVLCVTTLGGFVKITSIGRSWEKGPVVAAAPAHLPELQ
jgi:hypothetical protein